MRIGNTTLPSNRLPILLLDVARIYQAYPKPIIHDAHKDDDLAKLLGYSSSHNGAYWNRLSAMKYYGLLEGRPHVRLTELAKKLTTARNERERSGAYFEAVCNIVLWRELYKRHKFTLPKQNLWKSIAEITECTSTLARTVEPFVRGAFEVDTNSVRTYTFEPPSGVLQVEVSPGTPPVETSAENAQIEIRAGPYYYRMPFTAEDLRAAIEILKAIKAPERKPGQPKAASST